MIDAGIVILQDGTPCLVYNEVADPVVGLLFSYETFQISLLVLPEDMQDIEELTMEDMEFVESITLEYPLDPPFVGLLEERGTCAVAFTHDGEVEDMEMVPVFFTEEP